MAKPNKKDFYPEHKSFTKEFGFDQEKREELLVARIYRLSYLLGRNRLNGNQEEQVKLFLEDALSELEHLNQLSMVGTHIKRVHH